MSIYVDARLAHAAALVRLLFLEGRTGFLEATHARDGGAVQSGFTGTWSAFLLFCTI
jgi:hypothetical protein